MKISNDIGRLAVESRTLQNPAARRNAPADTAGMYATPAGPQPGWPAERRAGEHRISEALSIAQMAQHVLQRAVEISSRLRNMAMDAMANRRVDYGEIATASAELSAAMGEYAGKFAHEAPPMAALGIEDMRARNENMRLALDEMRSYAAEVRDGRPVDLSRVEGFHRTLETGFAENERAVELFTRRGLDMAREYMPPGGAGNTGSITIALSEAIERDFNEALLAQGNISGDAVRALLNA